MHIKNKYQPRPIRFLELYPFQDWQIKIYSISAHAEFVQNSLVELAKKELPIWLKNSKNYPLDTYKIATLILHEGKEGCFAIINWWIDENMLQQAVFLAPSGQAPKFELYSDKGMISCVWELEIIWFERNAWVREVLKNAPNPRFDLYLSEVLNKD